MSEIKKDFYFAYGSNLDINQMKKRCIADPKFLSIGYLPGHRLTFSQYFEPWGGGIANVVETPKSKVWGVIYELSREALEQLDAHEGYYGEDSSDYTRTQHMTITPEGQRYLTWVYTLKRKDVDFIPPSQRYMNIIKDAAKAFGFPESYRLYLDSVETVEHAMAEGKR
jgi:gamma-glutamylcyclotransferase (GGCT)/AIG2-like uncharacterized protein YtfP